MELLSDSDAWSTVKPEYLWVTDKLMLAKQLGYLCGPAGVLVPANDYYIVRPCVNYRMMSRGATIQFLDKERDEIPDGYFWCESYYGRHLSFDYSYGKQVLAVEGFRDNQRLDRFCKWQKVEDSFTLPDVLQNIANHNQWLNVEVIGTKVIEAHFRYNDDFANHSSDVIFPVWKDKFYPSASGDRLGFMLK